MIVIHCRKHAFLAGVCLLAWVLAGVDSRSAGGDPTVPAAKTQPEQRAVATVNGEAILEADFLAALPTDALDATLQDAKQTKLARMVEMVIREQFLRDRKIEIPQAELAKRVEKFKERVTTEGCPCCGTGYASFEQFMDANWFTMAEIRRMVRNECGFQVYLDRAMAERVAPHGAAEAVKEHRGQIEKDFVQGSMMLFDFREDAEFDKDPKGTEARKEKAAAEAWQRLEKGEPFEKVGDKLADHMLTPESGGWPTNILSSETKAAWLKLEPGKYCAPFKSAEGYRIIKRVSLTDEDVLNLLKRPIESGVADAVSKEYVTARSKAKIEYFKGGAQPGQPGQPAARSTTMPPAASVGGN